MNSTAVQACDGCRVRKVRCVREPDTLTCNRCARLRFSCTFDKPVKARGPKKRARTSSVSSDHDETTPRGQYPASSAFSFSSAHNSTPNGAVAAGSSPSFANLQRTHAEHCSRDGQTECMNVHTKPAQPGGTCQDESSPTDFICPRPLFLQILEHYLLHLYPLIPVVHRPSFRRDVANVRDAHDPDFLALEIAICAAVVGTMPSRFASYRSEHSAYPFESRKQLLCCCYDRLVALRGQDFFDSISYSKWATSYLFSIAFFQIGEHNRARMLDVESMQLGRLLHMHQATEYEGLNLIETQLRKKGFWLLFYTYIHSRLQSLRKERLSYLDQEIVHSIDPERLLPLDRDDEAIEEDDFLAPIGQESCLTTGFITHSRVFWAAIQDLEPLPHSTLSRAAARVEAKINNLKYMLDNVAAPLRPWTTSSTSEQRDQSDSQYASMRANLHVTHLWLQSILIDQLEVMTHDNMEYQHKLWQSREDLARQLLHLLHGIQQADLEPNGLHLAYKVRDVAVGLFACPFQSDEPPSQRAAIYVREFTEILSRLDASGTVNTTNLQSWVDTDREKGPITPGRGALLRGKNMAWP